MKTKMSDDIQLMTWRYSGENENISVEYLNCTAVLWGGANTFFEERLRHILRW